MPTGWSDPADDHDPRLVHRLEPLSLLPGILVWDGANRISAVTSRNVLASTSPRSFMRSAAFLCSCRWHISSVIFLIRVILSSSDRAILMASGSATGRPRCPRHTPPAARPRCAHLLDRRGSRPCGSRNHVPASGRSPSSSSRRTTCSRPNRPAGAHGACQSSRVACLGHPGVRLTDHGRPGR